MAQNPNYNLFACGRTSVESVEGRPGKRGNIVDGARFESYDPDTQTIKLRVDDSQVPEFWLEIKFFKKDLEKFVRDQELLDFETERPAVDFQ
jgi:hypothetical protein